MSGPPSRKPLLDIVSVCVVSVFLGLLFRLRTHLPVFSDSWYHLAEVKSVIATGHISNSNFYPATHILLSSVSEFSGVGPTVLFRGFPAVVSFFILSGAYFACKWLGINHKGGFVGV